jgi:hypothetical protein
MEEINSSSSGLTDWQLKLSYWYVTNKLFLRQLLVIFLIFINCALWGFIIYGVAYWGLNYNQINSQTASLLFSPSDSLVTLEAMAPKQLMLSDVKTYNSGEDYDLMAEVNNPNDGWLAEFDYAFITNTSSTVYFRSFALPGQRKILASMSSQDQNAVLEIKNVKWMKIADFTALQKERDYFTVSDQEFLAPTKAGNPSQVKLKITNDSAYSYWEGDIVVLLYGGSDVVAFGYVPLNQFKSGESRTIEFNWLQPLGSVVSLEVIPEINFADSANVMPPS